MSVCFSTRSSLRGSQRKEREKGGKMSLFSLKKHSLFLSLSLSFSSKALSLSFFDILCFGCRFVFFFLSFRTLLFVLGEIKRWSSLSLFSLQGEIGNHIIRLSLSLSLSYEARVLANPISLSNAPRHTKRERDDHLRGERRDIDASDINSRAKEEEKKRWIGFFFSSCGTAATKSRRRVKDENA